MLDLRKQGLFTLVLALAITSCSDSAAPADETVFTFREETSSDLVRLQIRNQSGLDEANRLLASGEARWVVGTPRRGDGGFNTGFSWHLDPTSISFAEVTIEACQSAASMVNDDLDYWIGFGQLCIWGVVQSRDR